MTKQNSIKILIFILVLITGIVITTVLSLGFIGFIIYGLLVSFLFPIIYYELDKDAVDFWYYTLGVIGVTLLFYSQVIESKKYTNINQMLYLKDDIREMEYFKLHMYDELFIKDSYSVASQFAISFREQRDILDSLMPDECTAQRQNRPGGLRGSRRPRYISQHCQNYIFAIGTANHLSDSSTVLKNIQNSNLGVVRLVIGDKKIAVLDDIYLGASDVAGLFFNEEKDNSERRIRLAINKVLDEHAKKYAVLKKEVNILKDNKVPISKLFLSSTWPYLLCIALCMKIARKKYISDFYYSGW